MATVVVGTKKGALIMTRTDGRSAWTRHLELKGWSVTASTRDETGKTYLAACSDIYGPAVFASDDLATWRQCDGAPRYQDGETGNALHRRMANPFDEEPTPPRQVDQIWTLHAAHGRLYAGVSEAGLFTSDDQGKSWQPVAGLNDHDTRSGWEPGAGGLCAHTILTDKTNKDRLWVGISAAGFFRSDDGGKTFTMKNDGVSEFAEEGIMFCVHCVTHNPDHPDLMFRQDHRGVYRSEDGGDRWTLIEQGLPEAELSDGHKCTFGFPIVMHQASGALFVVPQESDGMRIPSDGRLTVYRSMDKGETWAAQTTGLPSEYLSGVLRGAMDVDQASKGGVYFGTTAGSVFGTEDLGDSWSEIASGLPRINSVRVFSS